MMSHGLGCVHTWFGDHCVALAVVRSWVAMQAFLGPMVWALAHRSGFV